MLIFEKKKHTHKKSTYDIREIHLLSFRDVGTTLPSSLDLRDSNGVDHMNILVRPRDSVDHM